MRIQMWLKTVYEELLCFCIATISEIHVSVCATQISLDFKPDMDMMKNVPVINIPCTQQAGILYSTANEKPRHVHVCM